MDALFGAVLVERKPLTLPLGPLFLSYTHTRRETNIAIVKNDQPFAGISDLMTQNFEQTRKAMEKYADLLEKGMKASPWLDADLNKKMQSYIEKNIAAANEFMRKLSEAKDVQSFWQVQTDFMQTQWKTFSEEMKDLGETVTKSMRVHSRILLLDFASRLGPPWLAASGYEQNSCPHDLPCSVADSRLRAGLRHQGRLASSHEPSIVMPAELTYAIRIRARLY